MALMKNLNGKLIAMTAEEEVAHIAAQDDEKKTIARMKQQAIAELRKSIALRILDEQITADAEYQRVVAKLDKISSVDAMQRALDEGP